MSYISFESGEGAVLIGGRERARMIGFVDNIAWAMHSRGQHFIDPKEERQAEQRYCGPFAEDNFGERLGWVCLLGDDVTKLIAHIHGQCEIHGWVHPDDGDWFAGLVEQARERGFLGDDIRNNYGSWAEVADLARRSTTPLVTSYSVSEGWPDVWEIAQERPDLFSPSPPVDDANEDAEDDEAIYEAWDGLTPTDQRRIADEAIQSIGPRWHPAEWGTHWSSLVAGRNPYAQIASRSGEQPPVLATPPVRDRAGGTIEGGE